MAMNFGKNNRSVAFNPTSAFPLDARSYFESYDAAAAAALTAREAGSTDSVYYYGQILTVVENGVATQYTIQPDNKLVAFGGEPEEEFQLVVDEKSFIVNTETGELNLKNFESAAAGMVATKDIDGNLTWVAPVDAYTKDETDAKIAAAAHLKRKIVNSIADIHDYIDNNDDAEQYIFMVPADEEFSNDKYDEYMIISIAGSSVVEKVGSWEINLEDYATKNEVDKKVDKVEGSRLITDAEGQKLAQVNIEAEKNIINSVSTDFEIDNNRQLILKPITISKVSNLQDTLNNKVDTKEGHRLINPTEIEKLGKLSIDDDGELGISTKVNIENVQGLEDWLNSNAGSITGLSENNLTNELYNKLVEQLTIKTVNTTQLDVIDGHLNIKAIEAEKITGLNDLLALKADASSVSVLSTKVGSLESFLNDYKTEVAGKFEDIEDRLTWHGL